MLRLPWTGIVFATVLAAISYLMADQNPGPTTHRDTFTVIGLEARTSNAREMTSGAVIGALWGRLMKDGLLAKIPNRAGNEVIALYTDYESDKDGAYTYLLGARVTSAGNVPEGMKARTVPADDYMMFAAQGKLANDAVVGLWKQVWALETEHRIARAYRSDYEVHHFGENGVRELELYIGVKN